MSFINEEDSNLFINVVYSSLIINNNIQSESAVINQITTFPISIIECDFNSNDNQTILVGFKIISSNIISCDINIRLIQIQIIDDKESIISPIYETVLNNNNQEYIFDGIENSIGIGKYRYVVEIYIIENDDLKSISRAYITLVTTASGGSGTLYVSGMGTKTSFDSVNWGSGKLLPVTSSLLQNYKYGIKVVPTTGSTFLNWTGPVANTSVNPTTIKISSNSTLVANFKVANPNLIIKMKIGTATEINYSSTYGVVSLNGTAYSTMASYTINSTVTLKFTNGTCKFVKWTTNVTNSTSNPTTVIMSTTKTVVVYLTPVTKNITINRSGGIGNVNTSAGLKTEFPVTFPYTKDSKCTVTALPSTGNSFVSWTGTDAITGNPATQYVTASTDKTITVKFSTTKYKIIVQIYLDNILNPNGGTVTFTPNFTEYNHGTEVSALISPKSTTGYYSCSGFPSLTTTCTVVDPEDKCFKFTIASDLTIRAYFKTKYCLTVDENVPGGVNCPITIRWNTDLYTTISTFPTTICKISYAYILPTVRLTIGITGCSQFAISDWDYTGTLEYPSTQLANAIKVTTTHETLILNLSSKKYTLNYKCCLYTTSTVITDGTITTSPNNPSGHQYDYGEVVKLTESVITSGYTFKEWSYLNQTGHEIINGDPSITVNMKYDINVIAYFKGPSKYKLTIGIYLNGISRLYPTCGYITVDGVAHVSSTIYEYLPSPISVVDLTTTPIAPYIFDTWSINTSTPTITTTTVTMNANKTVNAYYKTAAVGIKKTLFYEFFRRQCNVGFYKVDDIGTLTLVPPNITTGMVDGSVQYDYGSTVNVEVNIVDTDYIFYHYILYDATDSTHFDDQSAQQFTDNSISITMDTNKLLYIYFTRPCLTIRVFVNGTLYPDYSTICTIEVDSVLYSSGSHIEFTIGDVVSLSTTPIGTYIFSEWSTNTSTPTNVNTTATISDDMTIDVYYISSGTTMVKLFYHFLLLERSTMTSSIADDNTGYLNLSPPDVDTTSIHNGVTSYVINSNVSITCIAKSGYSYVESSIWNLSNIGLTILDANINALDTSSTSSLVIAGTLSNKITNPYSVNMDVNKLALITFEKIIDEDEEICKTITTDVIIHPISDSNSGQILELIYNPTFTTLTDVPVSFSFKIACPFDCICEITIYRDTLSTTGIILSTSVVYQDLNFEIFTSDYNKIVNIDTIDNVNGGKYKYYAIIKYRLI